LSSQIPEVVLIAVLSNYKPEQAETVLRLIIRKLKTLVENKRVLKKYINQLMMLSRLRKIEALTIKISEEMPIHFDIETDTLYLKGIEDAAAQKDHLFVRSLLLDTDFSDEKIARLVGVTLEYVQNVRLGIEQEKEQEDENKELKN
jgi:hypothetical protein